MMEQYKFTKPKQPPSTTVKEQTAATWAAEKQQLYTTIDRLRNDLERVSRKQARLESEIEQLKQAFNRRQR